MAGRLLISAAHTLENPGAIYQDLREADLTRKLLKLTIPHLEKLGVTYQAVPLDLPLLQRIEWINATGYTEEQGDVMVELHINDGGKRGIEGWYRGSPAADNKSQKLTESLANYICEKLKYTNQGSKSEYEHELTSLLILNSINASGTAIEILFIDNPEDIAILKDETKLDEVAKVIAEGIKNYLDNPNKPTNTATPAVQTEVNNAAAAGTASGTPAAVGQVVTPPIPQPAAAAPAPFAPPVPNFGGGFNPQSSGLPTQGFGGTARPSFGGGLGASGLGGGNSPFGSFGGGGFGGAGGMGGGNKATLMDRDERKKMIKEVHQMILGKDPKPADENYYLNTGITKEELIKKLTESEDFKKMVEDSKKVKDLDDKIQKLESEVEVLKANSKDSQDIQVSLNELLRQKNIMISRLYTELVNHGIINVGEHFESRKKPEQSLNSQVSNSSTPETLTKKITKLVMRFTKV